MLRRSRVVARLFGWIRLASTAHAHGRGISNGDRPLINAFCKSTGLTVILCRPRRILNSATLTHHSEKSPLYRSSAFAWKSFRCDFRMQRGLQRTERSAAVTYIVLEHFSLVSKISFAYCSNCNEKKSSISSFKDLDEQGP